MDLGNLSCVCEAGTLFSQQKALCTISAVTFIPLQHAVLTSSSLLSLCAVPFEIVLPSSKLVLAVLEVSCFRKNVWQIAVWCAGIDIVALSG